MAVLFIFISIIIGSVVGYMNYPWYLIFVGGLLNTITTISIYPYDATKIRTERGEFAYLLYFIWLIVPSSLLPAVAYFIFKLPSLL